MAANEFFVKPELTAERAHLVLEQLAQRLDQLHVHSLGQPPDIMMALDRHRRAAGERHAFDHVGIERALGEKFGRASARSATQFGRFLFKHRDEFAADELALGLGLGDPGEAGHEAGFGVDHHQRDVVMIAEQAFDLLAFVEAEQPVIDEHAGQLCANRFVDQDRGDRGINPARQAADDPSPIWADPDLVADFADLVVAVGAHRPVTGHAAHPVDEIGEQLGTVGSVDHLGMELCAVVAPRLVGDDRERRAVGHRDDVETGRELRDLVAVAHPHLVPLADRP